MLLSTMARTLLGWASRIASDIAVFRYLGVDTENYLTDLVCKRSMLSA